MIAKISKRKIGFVILLAVMAACSFVFSHSLYKKANAATSLTLGDYTFESPWGWDINYELSGNKIQSVNGGGWQSYAVTTVNSGSQDYYYKLTFNSNKGYTAGNTTESIRFGLCLYLGANAYVDASKDHLSVALTWNYDEAAPSRVALHDICFCDAFITEGSIWTDNWMTYSSSAAASLVPTDQIEVEVYKIHGTTTDEYRIVVAGSAYSYFLANSVSDTSTSHKVGFYLYHENPASGYATMSVSNFTTTGGTTPEPTPSPSESVALGGSTFANPWGFSINYETDENVVKTVNGGGWQNYAMTELDSGSQNYYYKLTFNSDKGYTAGNTSEEIYFGIALYVGDLTDASHNHLSVALKWNYDEAAPERVQLHDILFCDTYKAGSNIWTDNWQTFSSGAAASLVPTDNITIEVFKIHGESYDTYGVVVVGEMFSYNLAETVEDTSTTHQVGFWAFHNNPASGAATITVSDFVTCNDAEYKASKAATLELNGSVSKSATVGAKVKVPAATAIGAFGQNVMIEPKVTLNGKAITLKSRSFTPTDAGEYKVTWSGVDFWGNELTAIEKTITVSAADEEDEPSDEEPSEETSGGCSMATEISAASMGAFILIGAALITVKAIRNRKENA